MSDNIIICSPTSSRCSNYDARSSNYDAWVKLESYKRKLSRSLLWNLEIFSCIVCGTVILATCVGIPSTLLRLRRHILGRRTKSRNELIWRGGKLTTHLNDLPTEIMCAVFRLSDTRSLLRLSQTCRHLHAQTSHESVWISLLKAEWPEYSTHPSLTNLRTQIIGCGSWQSRTAYHIYQLRWITLGCSVNYTHGETLHDIMVAEMRSAIGSVYHITMLPVKVMGVLSMPLYWACRGQAQTRNSPSLACLRCIVT
jgi:F-box-like